MRRAAGAKPDYTYTAVRGGVRVEVRIYHAPYAVSVRTGEVTRTYPLTFGQYSRYCDDAERVLHPSGEVTRRLRRLAEENYEKYHGDPDLARFWRNALINYDCEWTRIASSLRKEV